MNNFYKLTVLQVLQLNSKSGAVFTGRITFEELLTIHRLTERKESNLDPYGEVTSKIDLNDDEEFQRHLNPGKLNDLNNFIKNSISDEKENVIFPSSVIISLDLNENNSESMSESEIENLYTPDINSCFVTKSDHYFNLYIPKTKRICLIVDGQHRFSGLKKFLNNANNEDLIKKVLKFEFISTILLGYDSYQVAEVFANVNFNQKPVNKSLYYDIFGSSADSKNEIQLAHFLALHMQNNAQSPLEGMIKLLGKGYGLFSQAFFVEKILIHFKSEGVWNDLYLDYESDGTEFRKIPVFLKAYFRAVQTSYNKAWPKKVSRDEGLVYSPFNYEYILCKTTGMGAIFRLIRDIFPIVENLNDENLIYERCLLIFGKISNDDAEKLFSKNGEFGRGGSEGFQIRLYKYLKEKLLRSE